MGMGLLLLDAYCPIMLIFAITNVLLTGTIIQIIELLEGCLTPQVFVHEPISALWGQDSIFHGFPCKSLLQEVGHYLTIWL